MRSLSIEDHIIRRYGDLVVVNKPFDWATSGRSLDDEDCVQFHMMRHFGQMVWAIHQLDADTSGLCLFTLDKKQVIAVKNRMADARTKKEYLAIVKGEPSWDRIEECSSIGEVSPGCLGVHPNGRSARSLFEVLDRSAGFSVLRVRIYTGRTHQIRIHLQYLGFPLLGEEWYVDEPCTLHPRQALHAYKMEFSPDEHTSTDASTDVFTAPLAEDLLELAKSKGLRFAIGE